MRTNKELKDKLDKIIEIMSDAKVLVTDSYFMLVTDTSEKFTLVSRDKFLRRVQSSLWKLAIIELTKLFGSKKDNLRLDFLISQMINNFKNSEWSAYISKEDLNKLKALLDSSETAIKKKNLREIRDEHYAHTDITPSNHIDAVKFFYDDFKYLINLAEYIVNALMNKVFDVSVKFVTYNGEDVNNFLKQHLEYRKLVIISRLNK
ncbi:MAG: hypothetical protein FVQ77_07090 [Cytophagales bacterium]|nr:hypothetical protein [Cytophagales bacterium]